MKRRIASLVLAAAAAVVFLVADPFGHREDPVRPLEEPKTSEVARAPLAPAPVGAPVARTAPETAGDASPATPRSANDAPTLHGVVVDRDSGRPMPGASIEASAARFEPGTVARPRRPGGAPAEPRITGPVARSTSDAAGRFALAWSPDHPADLRISAGGHLDEMRSAASTDEDLKISLRLGIPMRGRVHRADGAGIDGATVRADSTPRDAGERAVRVASTTQSDGTGSFEVLGLPGVMSSIYATHPNYMPASIRVTPESGAADVTMVPAARTWFRLRSVDGRPLSAPTVQWTRTSETGSQLGVGVVDFANEAPEAAERTGAGPSDHDAFGPVKVPGIPSDGVVRFTVRVVGYLPFTSEALEPPADGGERTIDATLERDPTLGSIAVRLRDPDGRDLPFPAGETSVTLRRLDTPAIIGRPTERGGAVVFEGLAAGTYQVAATNRRFGAATATAIVEGGREFASDLALPIASTLRVRVVIEKDSRRRVHFQLVRDGEPIAAFEDPPPGGAAPMVRSPTHFFAGSEGTLLRGLSQGRYGVRVLSPDFIASAAEVDVSLGGTAEIELREKPR